MAELTFQDATQEFRGETIAAGAQLLVTSGAVLKFANAARGFSNIVPTEHVDFEFGDPVSVLEILLRDGRIATFALSVPSFRNPKYQLTLAGGEWSTGEQEATLEVLNATLALHSSTPMLSLRWENLS